MSTKDMDAWLQRMEEVAFLPSDDPMRLELEKDLSQQGQGLKERWLEILSETEDLRLKVIDVQTPGHLQQRLLNDLEGHRSTPSSSSSATFLKWWPVAAALILGIFIGSFWNQTSNHNGDTLQQVVLLAADDHINDRRLVVTTSDLDQFERELDVVGRLPVALPTPAPGFQLQGGRHCYWGEEKVVYSLWKKNGMEYSLIQFDPVGMDLPQNQTPQFTCCDEGFVDQLPMDLMVWVEHGRGYALVGRHGSVDPKPWQVTVF
jgi:hypothetical protein